MEVKFGITSKLLIWFCLFVLIFYGTILLLFINIQQVVRISENIVNTHFEITSLSKKMIGNLLEMEESDKKYHLLRKEDYIGYFTMARTEFEQNLRAVLAMEPGELTSPSPWRLLYQDYQVVALRLEMPQLLQENGTTWIEEATINEWVERITKMQAANERSVELATRELNRRGRLSARNGLIGLGTSSIVGLLGILFLSYSMIRPLRELIKGIGSISRDRFSKPITVRSRDEFGELAAAFNEMAVQLKEEERMRSDFISMLSHEIRTPLTSIRESVNMIAEEVMGAINEKQRKFLEIASGEIGRICDLLNHLMQVSRLESVTLTIRQQPIDTALFISGCVRHLQHIAEAKKIEIVTQIPPNTPKILGDPEHLQRVLFNLLDNAAKFSPEGSRIRVSVDAGGRNHLSIKVSDSGPGIPDEEQTLIFNKYYQTKSARDHMDGVGLGLNISKHIIETHGGAIWVESKIGEGSTFSFSLPLAREK
ncbi:MAG: sensor histidine kinase [Thermodesulfobacteriota bacterium]